MRNFNKLLNLLELAEIKISVAVHLEDIPYIKADLKAAERALVEAMDIVLENK